jgi:hypothetical protein
MADIKTSYATGASLTITLASLANGSGRASTLVDNQTNNYLSADVRVRVTTGGTSATGYVEVYLIRSDDGTNFDDAFGGSDAAYTPVNALLLGTIATPATATYSKVFDTAELGLSLPAEWCIGIVNRTGNTLNATAGNHSVTIREKYLTVA